MANLILSDISIPDIAAELVKQVLPQLISEINKSLNNKETKTNYLSKKEVSQKYRITVRTLTEWTKSGRVPAYRIGRRILYKENEIDKALTVLKTGKGK